MKIGLGTKVKEANWFDILDYDNFMAIKVLNEMYLKYPDVMFNDVYSYLLRVLLFEYTTSKLVEDMHDEFSKFVNYNKYEDEAEPIPEDDDTTVRDVIEGVLIKHICKYAKNRR